MFLVRSSRKPTTLSGRYTVCAVEEHYVCIHIHIRFYFHTNNLPENSRIRPSVERDTSTPFSRHIAAEERRKKTETRGQVYKSSEHLRLAQKEGECLRVGGCEEKKSGRPRSDPKQQLEQRRKKTGRMQARTEKGQREKNNDAGRVTEREDGV